MVKTIRMLSTTNEKIIALITIKLKIIIFANKLFPSFAKHQSPYMAAYSYKYFNMESQKLLNPMNLDKC